MRKELIGSVGVDSGQLMVCDPCYIESEWKDEKFVPEPGVVVDPKSGQRFVYGVDFANYEHALKLYGESVNNLLKSGILVIEEKPDEKGPFSFSYDGCCKATLRDSLAGELKFKKGHSGAGIAFSSGYGDGLYPVFAHYNGDGRIVRVTIEMGEEEA